MNWQTALLVLAVVFWAAAQYGLAAHALVDLRRRPTVRGNNKVVWTLVILGIPIAGALAYMVYGPTSFIRFGPTPVQAQPAPGRNVPQARPPDLDDHPEDWRSLAETASHRIESRGGRSTDPARQHAQPAHRLPEILELPSIDGERDEPHPEPVPRRAANRLVRQARRGVRR